MSYFFCTIIWVILMVIYLDLVIILNFCYDFLLLLTINIILKRNSSLKRILSSALFGALSIFLLFLNINTTILFLIKLFSGLLMCIIAFKYKNIKYTILNYTYLFMVSVILAGFLYFLSIEFSYKQEGLIFFFDGISINYIVLLIIAPLILIIYIRQVKKLKEKQNLYYKVKIVINSKKTLILNGYIDSGNVLKDHLTKKYIIITNKRIYHNKNPIYVPYKSVNKRGLLECFKIKYIEINSKQYTNYLLGVMDTEINIDGVDCILNAKLLEDI